MVKNQRNIILLAKKYFFIVLMSFQFSRAFSGVIKVNGQRAQQRSSY